MRRSTLYLLAAAVLWGTTFPAIDYGLLQGRAGPFTFAFARFAVAALSFAAVAAVAGRLRLGLLRSPWVWAIALFHAAGYAGQFLAQESTNASKTSLLIDINVVFIAILGFLFLGERHGWEIPAALALGLGGVVLLSTGGDPDAVTLRNDEFAGDSLAFASGLVWALSYVGIKAFLDRHPSADGVELTLVITVLTAALLLPLALATEGARLVGTPSAWAMIIYLGVGPTTLAFWLWQEALRTQTATSTAILLLLEIVVAVGIGVTLLGDRLTGPALGGAGLIVAATILAARSPPVPPAAAPPPAPVDATPKSR